MTFATRGAGILLVEIKNEQSIVINQPVGEIFDYVSDLENMVDWSSVVIAIRKLSSERLEVGANIKATIRFLGRWLDMAFEIVECEPDHCLTIKSTSGLSPCLFSYRFEPVPGGTTILSVEAAIHSFSELMETSGSVITNAVRRQIEYDLLTLKDILEARAPIYGVID